MPRRLRALAACALLAVIAGPAPVATAQDGMQATAPDTLRAAEVRRLVHAAADAPAERFEAALGELRGFPGVTWREVHDVLAAGREYATVAPPTAATEDLAVLTEIMRAVPWRPGEVQVLDLGDTPEHWYRAWLPARTDPQEPLRILFNVGGFQLPPDANAPDGWCVVGINDMLFHVPELGGVRLSLTAGTASQTIVLSILADLERRMPVDRDRVFMAGFSRGGNATLYFAAHWPDLWAGAVAASGYYPVERDTWPNLLGVGMLLARGADRHHKGANDFTKSLGGILRGLGHADLTEHVTDGRADEDGFGEKAWEWMAARRREPLPDEVTYTWRDPRHRGAYWVEILDAKDTGGTRPVVIGQPGDTTAESFPVHRRPSTVTVRRTGDDEVEITSRNVARLRLLLSPAQFDLSKPLTVRAGTRRLTVDVTPTIGGLVRRFRRDRDRSRLFPAAVDIDL